MSTSRPSSNGYPVRGPFGLTPLVLRIVIVAVLAVTVSLVVQARKQVALVEREAAEARQQSLLEREKFESLSRYVEGVLSSADPKKRGRPTTVADVLTVAGDDLDVELDEHPALQASLRSTLGNTWRNMGRYEEAEVQLREALKAQRLSLGEHHPDTLLTMKRLATVLTEQSEFQEAEELLRKRLKIYKEFRGEKHEKTRYVLSLLVWLYEKWGRGDEAEIYRKQTATD